jgi:uncharacterized protein (TIGR00106 family)
MGSYIEECKKILKASGLNFNLHATGTSLEGEWNDVFECLNRCHQRMFDMGVERMSTSVHIVSNAKRDETIQHNNEAITRMCR